jgi:hypothetical protein
VDGLWACGPPAVGRWNLGILCFINQPVSNQFLNIHPVFKVLSLL